MLKGLDLAFMPYIETDDKKVRTDFGAPGAAAEFRAQLVEFYNCLGFQLTRDTFMQHDKLHEGGCKFYFCPDPDCYSCSSFDFAFMVSCPGLPACYLYT